MGLGMNLIHLLFLHSRPPKRRQLTFACLLPAFYLSLDHSERSSVFLLLPSSIMEKVQYLTRSAIRRASTIEMPQQARQNLQNLFINFCLILICLLLICIIVMLLWSAAATSGSVTCQLSFKPSTSSWGGNTACSLPRMSLWRSRWGVKLTLSQCIHLNLVNKLYND